MKTTDASGGVTLTRRYDAFGNLEVGATTNGFAFTGREWDSETGLYYHRARYYDPKLGRFISEDPINSGSYRYAGNNPALFSDPTGLYLQLSGASWQKALGYLQRLVGSYSASMLKTRAIGNSQQVYLCPQGNQLAAAGPFGALIAGIINSSKLLEITMADPSMMVTTLSESKSLASFGGAATVGEEESRSGITQVFISEEAGSIASSMMTSLLYQSRSSDGSPLGYTTAGVLAHELGHAWANMQGVPINSQTNNDSALYWDGVWQMQAGHGNYRIAH
jgi:RHS repeat-associated protein